MEFNDPKHKEFYDILINGGYTIIKKTDHELLLSRQKELSDNLVAMTDLYENLKAVRHNGKIMELCGVIDSLTALLAIKPISYLDEFGKPVRNVSPFDYTEINKIRLTIIHSVQQLEPIRTKSDDDFMTDTRNANRE